MVEMEYQVLDQIVRERHLTPFLFSESKKYLSITVSEQDYYSFKLKFDQNKVFPKKIFVKRKY